MYGYSPEAISSIHIPNAYTSTDSSYRSSYISGAINSGVPKSNIPNVAIFVTFSRKQQASEKIQIFYYKLPITLLTNDAFLKVARPRSPSFNRPVVPVIKILSHFKSRWIIAGVRV